MDLEIQVDEDSDEIRHDIKSVDIDSNYPYLPRHDVTWRNFDRYSKKRIRYLNIKDNVAYHKLLKEHKIDFKPSKLLNISPSDRIFIMFEDYIALKIQESPPSSIPPFYK